jgi:hypothetical protein
MRVAVVLVVLAFVLAAAAAVVLWLRRRRALRRPCAPQEYAAPPPPSSWSLLRFEAGSPIVRGTLTVEAQPQPWREAIRDVGRVLRGADVRLVLFAHGTFVGDEPFALVRALGEQAARLEPTVGNALTKLLALALVGPAKIGGALIGDVGRFTPEYVSLFEAGLGGAVPCARFGWSGANHHLARLQGAAELARTLARHRLGAGRALVFAHSHGGQVLALLAQLLYEPELAAQLLSVLGELGPVDDVALALRQLRRARLDFVTLGTPPRYGWPARIAARVLHVVNHRGPEPLGGDWSGVAQTVAGDYIQQWGIAGSDFPAATAVERRLNERLSTLLGGGSDPRVWLANVRHRMRVAQQGHTLLVDYGDRGQGPLPNCVTTLFGHGIYTTYEAMLFHARLAARRLSRPNLTRSS